MATTVLIAHSDQTTLELVSAVLTRDGFNVVATPDGGDALSRFIEHDPALVLCSTELRVISGTQLCRQIKAQSDARVVMLASAAVQADPALMAEVECDVVLDPPFRYSTLKPHLLDWQLLGGDEQEAETEAVVFSFTVPVPELPVVEVASPSEPEPAAEAAGVEIPVPAMPLPIPLPTDVDAAALAPAAAVPSGGFDLGAQAPAAAPAVIEAPMESGPAAFDLSRRPPAPEKQAALPELELDDLVVEGMPPGETEPGQPVAQPAAEAPAPAQQPPVAKPARKPPGTEASVLPPSVPKYGDLTALPLPRLLSELYLATFSGIVHLSRQGVQRSLYFWGGFPVRVDSDQRDENLGQLLLSHGRITEEQCAKAAKLVEGEGCDQGEALVKLGILSQADLLDSLKEQTDAKVVNTFCWRDGSYHIELTVEFAESSVLNEVHPIKAIWRGVCEHYDLSSLMTFFGPLRQRYVVATDLLKVHYESLGPHLRDLGFAALLDGNTTFEDALRRDAHKALAVAQGLYVLLVTDMIRPGVKPGAAATVFEEERQEPKQAELVDYRQITQVCDSIAAEYLRLKEGDYFAVLGIGHTADPAQVEAAFKDKVQPYMAEQLPAGLPPDVLKRATEIQTVLSRARMVLRDPKLKERYLKAQQVVGANAAPKATPKATPNATSVEPPAAAPAAADGKTEAEQIYKQALVYLHGGDGVSARKLVERAIALDPREPTYRVALGRALMMFGSSAEVLRAAAACLQQALQLDPGHVMANLEMARFLAKNSSAKAAKPYLERVLQRSPGHVEARKLLAQIG